MEKIYLFRNHLFTKITPPMAILFAVSVFSYFGFFTTVFTTNDSEQLFAFALGTIAPLCAVMFGATCLLFVEKHVARYERENKL